MNLGAVLAMLLQAGVCSHVDLPQKDASVVRVIVCPQLAKVPDDTPSDDPMRKPLDCDETKFTAPDKSGLEIAVCAKVKEAPTY